MYFIHIFTISVIFLHYVYKYIIKHIKDLHEENLLMKQLLNQDGEGCGGTKHGLESIKRNSKIPKGQTE